MKKIFRIVLLIALAALAVLCVFMRTGVVSSEIFENLRLEKPADHMKDMELNTAQKLIQLLNSGDYENASLLTNSFNQKGDVLTGRLGEIAASLDNFSDPVCTGTDENTLTCNVTVTWLNCAEMVNGIADEFRNCIAEKVLNASTSREIYSEELELLPEVREACFAAACSRVFENSRDYCVTETLELQVEKLDDSCTVLMNNSLYNILSNGRAGVENAGDYPSLRGLEDYYSQITESVCEQAEYVRFHYSLDADAVCGFIPNAEGFGTTDDPQVIEQLLERAYARQLTEGKNLVWDTELNFIEKSDMKYYLDESVLALVWNEPIANTWGTFCEVVISDPSQFRRKIVNDTFNCNAYKYPYELAAETNSVVASTADLYNHWSREIGICVYGGEVLRFMPSCDVCFVTENGDFIMKQSDSFETIEEAQKFVDENEISFSMCFGPVTILNGENVSPERYRYGEIFDRYPRLMISQIDELHYLIVTSNQNPNRPEYSTWGCTLEVITEAMLAHGCTNAYTLDGGQTGAIMLNGKMMNPQQYRGQQIVSDIIYFATAVPSQEANDISQNIG